jgi:uncharacterized protein Yka (UPF0111/DUF47 family)
MSVENRGTFEQRLASLTAAFLDQLEACVEQVPRLLDRYADGESTEEIVEELGTRESECDRTNRTVRRLIAGSNVEELGIRLTSVHLHSGQIIELYQRLDEIANHLEQFATELAAIDPPRQTSCLAGLGEMAEHCVAGMAVLSRAVRQYVRALCEPTASLSITTQVARIRELESESDRVRDRIIASAFQDGPTATSLVYFQLATRLDAVVDTMEDVTDQMLLVTGNQDWIEIEPETDSQ